MLYDYANALPYLEQAARIAPQNVELQGHLAETYLNLGKSEQAFAQFHKAIALDSARPAWHHNLAVLYLRNGQPDAAKTHFKLALDLQPDNPTAQHMLAALEAKSDVKTAPAEYVKSLFDQYATY